MGGEGDWELWSDGRTVNIEALADRVIGKWEQLFTVHGL
jgi:hypothetical protein